MYRNIGVAIGITLILFCGINILSIVFFPSWDMKKVLDSIYWWGTYFTIMYISNHYLNNILAYYFSKEKQLRTQLIMGVVLAVPLSFLSVTLCNYLLANFFLHIPFSKTYSEENFSGFYIFPILISIIVSFVMYIISFYKNFYSIQTQKQIVLTEKISRQYDSLQQQLSPHFLFNSLNVLESLIEENQNQAQVFTQDLATIYRYVLQQENQLMISVSEELQFAKTYIHLMNQRFENAIQLSIDENITKDLMILPLSIQLALENAIKHNTFSEEKPLKITINQVDENLVVRNNLSPKTLKNTTQKGLANIQSRLATFGKNASIEKTENEFILTIPLLTQNQIIMENNYQSDKAQQVENRIKELKGFYNHLFSFIFINAGLIALNIFQNYYFGFSIWWVQWSLMGWGIGLAAHALRTFRIINPVLGKDWEERKRKELMNQ